MKQLLYLALVILAGVIAIKWYTSRNAPPKGSAVKTLTAEQAKKQLDADESIILLDVRTQSEYKEGHIPGSVCLPNESIVHADDIPYPQDARLFLYCRSGRRSAEAAQKLADMGYADVTNFGGIMSWPYEIVTE